MAESVSDKSSRLLNLGFSGDARDDLGGGGRTLFSAGWTLGDLHLKSPLDRAADALTARSEGRFSKLQMSLARLQTLSGPVSLYGALRGQFAFENLDSSEKMELGGAYSVRAYPEGEAYGDQGYVATIEARLALGQWMESLPGKLQLIGFVDFGQVKFSDTPWFTGSNNASRSGVGAGLNWTGPSDLALKLSYARKLGDAVATSGPDKDGRFWFQVARPF